MLNNKIVLAALVVVGLCGFAVHVAMVSGWLPTIVAYIALGGAQ